MWTELLEKFRELAIGIHPKVFKVENRLGGEDHYLLRPNGYTVETLQSHKIHPERVEQNVCFDELDGFAAYLNRFGAPDETVVFLQQSATEIRMQGVIDYHDPSKVQGGQLAAGWKKHVATFEPVYTPEWKLWTSKNQTGMEQAAFARFLEENRVDVIEPDAATLIEICQNLEMKSDVVYKKAFRDLDGMVQLQYSEEAKPVQNITIPYSFTIRVIPYRGESAEDVQCKVRYRLRDGVLTFFYEMVRPHKVLEACAIEMRNQLGQLTAEKRFPIYSATQS